MARLIQLRIAWIAAAAVILIGVAGTGVYLHGRPQAQPPSRLSLKTLPQPSVGTTTTTPAVAVAVLNVVSTSPMQGAFGEPVLSEITMRFNLPVDPSAMGTYFSVLPSVSGAFRQGPTPQEIVFKPDSPYPAGAPVSVLLRKGFPSQSGVALQNDYAFSFNTEVSSRDVVFQVGNQLARVYGAASGQTVTILPQFGNQVPTDLKGDIWKATAADVLAAEIHDTNGNYFDRPIDRTDLLGISQQPIANAQNFTVAEPDGIYLLLAEDANGVYGALWIDFSHFGVLLRQDDQKIVVGGENLSTGDTSPSFNITFYNLAGGVRSVANGSFSGTGEFKLAYGTIVDLAVASSGGEDVVIPLQAPQTAADIKVVGDLSATPQIFITTDRTAYQSGETVKFAGVVRTSNDQAYAIPAGMTVTVWTRTLDATGAQVAPVAADGTFSGSFPIPSTAFNPDGTDNQVQIFAGTAAQHTAGFSPFSTLVGALGPHAPGARISVSFDKATYVASDPIQATIAGVDASGQPLASKPLNLTIYAAVHATRPVELPSYDTPSTWGAPVQQNVTVTLDATGHATYPFKANISGQAADQEITLAATFGTGTAQALGARTAIVYQAAADVFFLPARTAYLSGDTVVAPFVVESTAGQRVAGAPMSWELDKTEYQGSTAIITVLASGSVAADAAGRGVVRAPYSGPAIGLTVRVRGKDSAGNVFGAALPIVVLGDPASLVTFGQSDNLAQLSVISDKLAYTAGDTAQLTITAPAAVTALMSLERGRIHSYKWIQLAAGDNPLSLNITPDLFPGFTLTFSYLRGGLYHTEGMPITVGPTAQLLKVTAVPDQKSYTKGQTAHVTVTVTDSSGTPVAAALIADGYDAAMSAYKLVDRASVAGAFFTPAARGTNASSSLLSIGSWGGRCGGGMQGPQPAVTNPGATAVWLPDVTTDPTGHATIDVPITGGPVRLVVLGSTTATLLGQVQVDLSVQ